MYIDDDYVELETRKQKTYNKKKHNNISAQSLPSFDKFCKMNFVFIPPKQKKEETNLSAGREIIKFINDTVFEKKVRNKLLRIYEFYWHKFERICQEVISSKYEKIYENIYNFLIFLKFCKESFIRTILLNTDQNANDFFQAMENYFDRKSGVKRKPKKKETNELDEVEEETEENKMIFFLTESRFKDMKNLYKYLEICDNNFIWVEDDKPAEKKMRLLIIREIHKIDTINFNIFISRILEYHQDPYSQFYYVLIFDVSYDPRGLFEKIKPNNLCKMVFNNIENISSKNIYKEILYKFIYEESESLFIPNPVYTKKIVDYVNNHQISIKSFKHYFKFLIIDFFLLNSWKRDEFLIYSDNLETYMKNINSNKNEKSQGEDNRTKKKEKIINSKKNTNFETSDEDDHNYKKILEKIFCKELNDIYGNNQIKSKNINNLNNIDNNNISTVDKKYSAINYKKSDVDYLVSNYHERRRIIDVFLHFYNFFEKLTEEISSANSDLYINQVESSEKIERFDKYQFFFDFLQFGAHPDIAINNRLLIIQKSFENTVDYLELIKIIAKRLELHLKNLDDSCRESHEMLKELHKIINQKGSKVKYNYRDSSNNSDNHLPLLDQEVYKRKLIDWLKNFLKMEEFILLFEDFNKTIQSLRNERRVLISSYYKYLVFHEIVNPSLPTIVIDSIQAVNLLTKNCKNSKKVNNNDVENKLSDEETCMIAIEEGTDFTKSNQYIILLQFLVLFSQAPAEFKLKFLFVEFLNQMGVEKENKEGVSRIKNYFLYFCHIFYLLGLLTRKRTKDDIYLKNYFQMTNYFVRR